jgi:hypothetical protein
VSKSFFACTTNGEEPSYRVNSRAFGIADLQEDDEAGADQVSEDEGSDLQGSSQDSEAEDE